MKNFKFVAKYNYGKSIKLPVMGYLIFFRSGPNGVCIADYFARNITPLEDILQKGLGDMWVKHPYTHAPFQNKWHFNHSTGYLNPCLDFGFPLEDILTRAEIKPVHRYCNEVQMVYEFLHEQNSQ